MLNLVIRVFLGIVIQAILALIYAIFGTFFPFWNYVLFVVMTVACSYAWDGVKWLWKAAQQAVARDRTS
jgi:hypothetical protein